MKIYIKRRAKNGSLFLSPERNKKQMKLGKLKTKVLGIILAFLIAVILSSVTAQ